MSMKKVVKRLFPQICAFCKDTKQHEKEMGQYFIKKGNIVESPIQGRFKIRRDFWLCPYHAKLLLFVVEKGGFKTETKSFRKFFEKEE